MKDAAECVAIGTRGSVTEWVDETNTAARYGSGSLPVYSTPAMIALMERAAVEVVDAQLPKGWVTVGTSVNINHVDATPLGAKVTAAAELIEVDRRRLVFSVTAEDPWGTIGHGTHERFCVEIDHFLGNLQSKERDDRDGSRL